MAAIILSEMKQKEIIVRLNEITSDYNFIYIIAASILKDFCNTIDYLEHRNSREHFNYNEASFLVGLWVKNSMPSIRNQFDFNERFKEVYDLMEKLHFTFISEGPKILEKQKDVSTSDFMTNGFLFKESFFYSSTGAYDFQYAKMFSKKYKYDEEWLLANRGFSLSEPFEYFTNVKNLVNTKLNSSVFKGKKKNDANDLLFPFTFTYEELTLGKKSFANITSCFIIELNKTANSQLINIGDFNEFQVKPIIKIGENKYFIPMPFYLAEAIYESPFYWMIGDEKYVSSCLKHRGDVGEEIVYNLFLKIFGASNTFKGVKIKENKTKTIAEIDVCAKHGNALIAVQIKSKKLTSISKQGDIDKIKDDFKKAVEDAYLQGVECEKAVSNAKNLIFTTDETKEIQEVFTSIEDTLTICIVLDTYPSLAHSSHILLYDKYEGSTICFTVFDLEVICRYLNTPEKLIDYFSKRINNCRHYYSENELCFLGFYLDHDLKKHDKYNRVMIDDSYGSKIDRIYYPEISGYNEQLKKRKVGRNDICPCGSNLKYKHCHGKS